MFNQDNTVSHIFALFLVPGCPEETPICVTDVDLEESTLRERRGRRLGGEGRPEGLFGDFCAGEST